MRPDLCALGCHAGAVTQSNCAAFTNTCGGTLTLALAHHDGDTLGTYTTEGWVAVEPGQKKEVCLVTTAPVANPEVLPFWGVHGSFQGLLATVSEIKPDTTIPWPEHGGLPASDMAFMCIESNPFIFCGCGPALNSRVCQLRHNQARAVLAHACAGLVDHRMRSTGQQQRTYGVPHLW